MKNCKDKAEAYIRKVESVFNKVKFKDARKEVNEAFDYARRYWFDAKHFFSEEDFASALACISYAEGILDALRLLNLIEFNWE
jgi:FAD synthetase